jgi:hypothetical protein
MAKLTVDNHPFAGVDPAASIWFSDGTRYRMTTE